eukprot:jgi/Mesvir1/27686/Mv07405-RA.2
MGPLSSRDDISNDYNINSRPLDNSSNDNKNRSSKDSMGNSNGLLELLCDQPLLSFTVNVLPQQPGELAFDVGVHVTLPRGYPGMTGGNAGCAEEVAVPSGGCDECQRLRADPHDGSGPDTCNKTMGGRCAARGCSRGHAGCGEGLDGGSKAGSKGGVASRLAAQLGNGLELSGHEAAGRRMASDPLERGVAPTTPSSGLRQKDEAQVVSAARTGQSDTLAGLSAAGCAHSSAPRYVSPLVRLVLAGATRGEQEQLQGAAEGAVARALGMECVLDLVASVQEAALALSSARNAGDGEQTRDPARGGPPPAVTTVPAIERRLIWFHHIKSLTKRKLIVAWGDELAVTGVCKPGYPGVLVVEGEPVSLAEYVERLHSLRWKAMAVRGESSESGRDGQTVDDLRRLRGTQSQRSITELLENGMSELATMCRDAGLESLFLTAMKIQRPGA